jgi:hypothetical protein
LKKSLGIIPSLDNALLRNSNALIQDPVQVATDNMYATSVTPQTELDKQNSVQQVPSSFEMP